MHLLGEFESSNSIALYSLSSSTALFSSSAVYAPWTSLRLKCKWSNAISTLLVAKIRTAPGDQLNENDNVVLMIKTGLVDKYKYKDNASNAGKELMPIDLAGGQPLSCFHPGWPSQAPYLLALLTFWVRQRILSTCYLNMGGGLFRFPNQLATLVIATGGMDAWSGSPNWHACELVFGCKWVGSPD